MGALSGEDRLERSDVTGFLREWLTLWDDSLVRCVPTDP